MPPRDLWARTSSAIDLERGRTSVRTQRTAGRTTSSVRSRSSFPLGALTGAIALVFVVGATLLSGQRLPPTVPDGTVSVPTGATAAVTPFPVAPREAKFVIGSGDELEITTSNISEVCPMDAGPTCETARISTGQDAGVSTAQGVHEAVINPSKSHVVLGTGNAVVVVPMITPSPVVPTPTPAQTFSAAGSSGVTAPTVDPSLAVARALAIRPDDGGAVGQSVGQPGGEPDRGPREDIGRDHVRAAAGVTECQPRGDPQRIVRRDPHGIPRSHAFVARAVRRGDPGAAIARGHSGATWRDHHRRGRHPRRALRRLLP